MLRRWTGGMSSKPSPQHRHAHTGGEGVTREQALDLLAELEDLGTRLRRLRRVSRPCWPTTSAALVGVYDAKGSVGGAFVAVAGVVSDPG